MQVIIPRTLICRFRRYPIKLSTNPRMTSTTAKSSKLIFAPGEAPPESHDPSSNPQQAAQFNVGKLKFSDLDSDPFQQFHAWFSHPALKNQVPETVCLSTAELPSGRVSSRMVYLKELDERGFVIYSNFGTSRKAKDLSTNPHASLTFWYKPLERQIRVQGRTERLTSAESQVYYDTRARGSRIGAWASQQSSVLKPQPGDNKKEKKQDGQEEEEGDVDDGRRELERQVEEVEKRFEGTETIPVPDFWGGLRIIPDEIEFWQGRNSRLHDRFLYTRISSTSQHDNIDKKDDDDNNHNVNPNGGGGGGAAGAKWKIERLSP